MPVTNPGLMSPEYHDALVEKGLSVYDTKLKPLLEPEHNNEYIAINVDTEDYALGRTAYEASRLLNARHPTNGRMIRMKIGPDPDTDIFARMFAAEQHVEHNARTKE